MGGASTGFEAQRGGNAASHISNAANIITATVILTFLYACHVFRHVSVVPTGDFAGPLLPHHHESSLQGKHAPHMGREVRQRHASEMPSPADSSVGLGHRPLCGVTDAPQWAQVSPLVS